MNWITTHVLAWTTSAAAAISIARIFTPSFMDMLIDIIVVCLVWVAAKLAATKVDGDK